MAKAGKKKKISQKKIEQLKESQGNHGNQERVNPFELRRASHKQQILGQKPPSAAVNMGVSRSRAQQKREETLLVEYRAKDKDNKFIDKRIGESDPSLSREDKALIRFQRNRQKKLLRTNKFNLSDDEDNEEMLTHEGQPLSLTGDFDDYVPSDDDFSDDGRIDKAMVEQFHFGGGLFRQKAIDADDGEEAEPAHRTRDDIMKEVIAKSKLFKLKHQAEREDNLDLIQELDDDTADIRKLLSPFKRTADDDSGDEVDPRSAEKSKQDDDFDRLTRELMMEKRAYATDRAMTEEEKVKLARDRLMQLEKERKKRMNDLDRGESDDDYEQTVPVPVSGDSLCDDYAHYAAPVSESDNSDEDEDEDGSGKEEGIDDRESVNVEWMEQAIKSLDEEKRALLTAVDKVPFMIAPPASVQELGSLLKGHSKENQSLIFQRIITCNHVSLSGGNKKKMEKFLLVLLQWFGVAFNGESLYAQNLDAVVNLLVKPFHSLLQQIPEYGTMVIKQKLRVMQAQLQRVTRLDSGTDPLEENLPDPVVWAFSAADLAFLLLLCGVYPLTDFQHPILTPCSLLMGQSLAYLPILPSTSIIDRAKCCIVKHFCCGVVHRLTAPTKKFVPELFVYLGDFLSCAAKGAGETDTPMHNGLNALLDVRAAKGKSKKQPTAPVFSLSKCLNSESELSSLIKTGTFRQWSVVGACDLLRRHVQLHTNLPCLSAVTSRFQAPLSALKNDNSRAIKTAAAETLSFIMKQAESMDKYRRPLVLQAHKPVALKTLKPKFHEGFNPSKDYDPDRDRANQRRLKRKIKAETKAAAREIKKDNYFLEQERAKKRRRLDEVKRDGYKRIMTELQHQQKHINDMDRQKGKKRK